MAYRWQRSVDVQGTKLGAVVFETGTHPRSLPCTGIGSRLALAVAACLITACATSKDAQLTSGQTKGGQVTDAAAPLNPGDAGIKHPTATASSPALTSSSAPAPSSPAGSSASSEGQPRANDAAAPIQASPDGGSSPHVAPAEAGTPTSPPPEPALQAPDAAAPNPSEPTEPTPANCKASGSLSEANGYPFCDMQLACDDRPLQRSRCYPEEGNTTWCDCYSAGEDSLTVQVQGGSLVDVCKGSVEFCDPAYHKIHGQPRATLDAHATDNADGCTDYGTYVLGSNWGAQITLGVQIEYGASCRPNPVDGPPDAWQCSCNFDGSQTGDWFYVQPEALPDELCANASTMCLHISQVQNQPGATCTQKTAATTEDACLNEFFCDVPGLLDGVNVTTLQDYSVGCGTTLACVAQPTEDAPDDAPRCIIQGPRHFVEVPLPDSTTPADACQAFSIDEILRLGDLTPSAPARIEWKTPFPPPDAPP